MLNEERRLWKYIVFTILTCGIYAYWFIYSIAQDVNIMCKDDGKQTGGLAKFILLSLLTCGIYAWYWYYALGNRLQENAPRYGLHFSENGTTILMWYIFGVLLCGIGPFIGMNILINNTNALAKAYNRQKGFSGPAGGQGNAYAAGMGAAGQGQTAYGQDQSSYAQNQMPYGQEPPVYAQELPAYSQEPPVYDQEPPVYGQDAVSGEPENGYSDGFNQPVNWQNPVGERRFCTECGSLLTSDSNFCTQCGHPVQREKAFYPQNQTANEGTEVLSQDWYSEGATTVLSGGLPTPPTATLYSCTRQQSILVDKDSFKLGKNAAAVDYQILNNTSVSRIHAAIHRRNGEFFIEDLESTNGTYINDERLYGEKPLRDGDCIRLADETFIFKL